MISLLNENDKNKCKKIAVYIAISMCLGTVWIESAEADNQETKKAAPEVDHLALAGILIQDGHINRARVALQQVDPDEKGLDKPRFYMLYGLVELKEGKFPQAVQKLRHAIRNGQTDPMVHIFLAQACFNIQDYRCSIDSIKNAKTTSNRLPGSFLIRAQSHIFLKESDRAMEALESGLKHFPGQYELMRHKVMLLINLGLYQQALVDGTKLLEHTNSCPNDYVAIAEALRRGHQLSLAIQILEEARLFYPNNEQILKQLSNSYLKSSQPLTASRILYEASQTNPILISEVAELYRRSGKPLTALRMNTYVSDQPTKVRQRLGLLIELQRFEQAAALIPRLSRLGLLRDDQTLYATAYIYYKTGSFDRAINYLKQIQGTNYFSKAIELRRAIEICRKDELYCN